MNKFIVMNVKFNDGVEAVQILTESDKICASDKLTLSSVDLILFDNLSHLNIESFSSLDNKNHLTNVTMLNHYNQRIDYYNKVLLKQKDTLYEVTRVSCVSIIKLLENKELKTHEVRKNSISLFNFLRNTRFGFKRISEIFIVKLGEFLKSIYEDDFKYMRDQSDHVYEVIKILNKIRDSEKELINIKNEIMEWNSNSYLNAKNSKK